MSDVETRLDALVKSLGPMAVAVSGGVDSSVATKLAADVIPPARLHAFFIDNGFMRDEDAMVIGLDRSRLHLTPGMTGPWQILGSRVPMQEMVGIDYLYVSTWSLWADMKLLVRTARHVLRSGNV